MIACLGSCGVTGLRPARIFHEVRSHAETGCRLPRSLPLYPLVNLLLQWFHRNPMMRFLLHSFGLPWIHDEPLARE